MGITRVLRQPEASPKLHGLDHLRAFAIIFVFIYHYGRLFGSPERVTAIGKFGWTGVDLFFVLSGYLIASQLFARIAQGKGVALKEFFIKRFFRILPLYWFILGLYFLIPAVHEREGLAPLWKYLFFVQNIGLDLRVHGTFSHAWSLCIEEQFYLVLPLALTALLYFKSLRKGIFIILALFVAGFFIRSLCWDYYMYQNAHTDSGWAYWYSLVYYPTWCRLDGLLAGVFIAAAYQFKPALKARVEPYGNALLLLSLAILTGAYFVCVQERSYGASVFGFPLVSIGYAVMLMGAISPASILYRFRSRISATIAALSYGIYLSHKIVLHLTQDYFSGWNIDRKSMLMFGICLITSFAAAWVLNKLIEKPFMRVRDHVLRKGRQAAMEVLPTESPADNRRANMG
ncbi:acyltransferase family protein [Chitinophaga vietnamensis]|uniref:acyltransferase family protein n=1 Tax=Chitinophaga vietnamensis TaxID=2593957 RepID=UPI0011783707|nr:acyltransferase [Chitinophaga vietnamensis]